MAVEYKDYYKILNVPRDADQQAISRAYRKLARQYHPDLNNTPEAEERFKQISEAYEVLKDPAKREKYDQLGSDWQEGQGFRPPPNWDFSFARGAGRRAAGAETYQGAFSDFFESLFGGSFQSAGGGETSEGAFFRHGGGTDQEAALRIRLEDAYHGATRWVTLQQPQIGPDGRLDTQPKRLKVKIPAGVLPGQKIRLTGQGAPGPRGARGDLYLKIEVEPHAHVRLKGRHLYTELALAPWEAALGANLPVPSLNGSVTLKVPPGTQSGQQLRLKGKGMPNPGGGSGDLYVTAQIKVPGRLSRKERELFEKLQKTSSFNPRART